MRVLVCTYIEANKIMSEYGGMKKAQCNNTSKGLPWILDREWYGRLHQKLRHPKGVLLFLA
jgi:guanylate kinase